jgi:hypothetical protein
MLSETKEVFDPNVPKGGDMGKAMHGNNFTVK